MWGGATFDVAYRFLHESPWERLRLLREKIPNIPFQMLLRGANAVGYTNYPDNLIRAFIRESARSGIDVFRIFDSLNWIPGMEIAIDEVLQQGKLCEATLCYTGDILDPKRDKYTLKYYVDMAKELEKRGAHLLCIKDMSGLLKPYAAKKLVTALKNEVGLPIHLHTHDTSGNQVAAYLMAAEAGVDIVDCAIDSMSSTTSQPSLNAVVTALQGQERDTGRTCACATASLRRASRTPPPISTATRCLAASTPTSRARWRAWAWATNSRTSRRCMSRSTTCWATL